MSNRLKMRSEPPDAHARPVFEHAFDDRAAHAVIGGEADIVQRVLGLIEAFEEAAFAAGFEIQVEVDGDAGVARPMRMRRLWAIAVKVAGGTAVPLWLWLRFHRSFPFSPSVAMRHVPRGRQAVRFCSSSLKKRATLSVSASR